METRKKAFVSSTHLIIAQAASSAAQKIAIETVPYHPWGTRGDPFSEKPCSNFSIVISQIGHPHKDQTLLQIKDWCHPLPTTEHIIDIVAMTESLRKAFNEIIELSLRTIFADLSTANNIVPHKFWFKAVRFQWWYFWRHASDFESMMIMVARLGLYF